MFKIRFFVLSILSISLLVSCSEDENIQPVANPGERPVLGPLSLSEIADTHTPYEHIFTSGGAANGRYQNTDDIRRLMDKIEEIFPEVTYVDEIERSQERGIDVWEVEIELPGGAELDFYISRDLFEVVEIEGDEVNLPYELDPGDNFITLAQAVAVAESALGDRQLTFDDWELSFDDGRWVYEFETERPDDLEIYVHAETGDLIGVYDDDDDNDDDD